MGNIRTGNGLVPSGDKPSAITWPSVVIFFLMSAGLNGLITLKNYLLLFKSEIHIMTIDKMQYLSFYQRWWRVSPLLCAPLISDDPSRHCAYSCHSPWRKGLDCTGQIAPYRRATFSLRDGRTHDDMSDRIFVFSLGHEWPRGIRSPTLPANCVPALWHRTRVAWPVFPLLFLVFWAPVASRYRYTATSLFTSVARTPETHAVWSPLI